MKTAQIVCLVFACSHAFAFGVCVKYKMKTYTIIMNSLMCSLALLGAFA